MNTLIKTTTGTLSKQMILTSCSNDDGEFENKAYDLLSEVCKITAFGHSNCWTDIMFDQKHRVYAIWAEDWLTCCNAPAKYVELDDHNKIKNSYLA